MGGFGLWDYIICFRFGLMVAVCDTLWDTYELIERLYASFTLRNVLEASGRWLFIAFAYVALD